jgi:cyclopropane fatty-acyl-phospholipid synthase-like methyltransferase
LTDAELAAMPQKTKKDPETVSLYRNHDFLEAYARHTARRIETTGYRAAVGAGDNWDVHGDLQRDFLLSRGLRSEHRLLDIGCGTGRLARKVVPILDSGNYFGVDIAEAAVVSAVELSVAEGWGHHHPTFWIGEIPETDHAPKFDFLWAFSVFIHLPQEIMESVMRRAAAVMHPGSRFFWAYVPEQRAWRSGVKQFRHTIADYESAAHQAGMTFDDVPNWIEKAGYTPARWTGSQRVAVSRLAA